MDLEIQQWRAVLKRLLSIIRVLTSQCLAFRETNERLFAADNGNFLKLVELLAEFDPVMEDHLKKIQRESKKWSVSYLSNNILNELINLMGKAVFGKIINVVKSAKYFSIIADCTPDVNHIDQLSLTIRIVSHSSVNNQYEIQENFIGFFEETDSTGEGVAKLIMSHLERLDFDLKWLRG